MTAPNLDELAGAVAGAVAQFAVTADPAAVAGTDQAWAMVRDNLENLGVDLDDPVAARAVIAVYEVARAGFSAGRAIGGACQGHLTATNLVTAAAVVAAQRHTRKAAS